MKTTLLTIIILAALVTSAISAQIYTNNVFMNQSTSRTSVTESVGSYTRMTAVFNGASSASNAASAMYGTVTMQCGATAAGPYTTMKDINGNAVTTTSNAHFNIDTLCGYFRIVWTRTKQKVNAWIRYGER